MTNTSFEIDNKVVDLFTISPPNSVINSVSFFCVSMFLFVDFIFYIKFLRLYLLKREVPPTIKNYSIDHEDKTL